MTERALRPGNVAAAAAVITGLLLVALPQYLWTFVQLALVTVAVSAGLHALVSNVPTTGWLSPFKWLSPFGETERRIRRPSAALEHFRARIGARRQRLEGGELLPPAVLRQLKPLVASALRVDPDDHEAHAALRGRVSPLAVAVLESEPLERASWLRTVRPDRHRVAETIHRLLDDLERASSDSSHARPS